MASIEIVRADLARADHQQAIVALVDAYARDPMGNEGRCRRMCASRWSTACGTILLL